MRLMDYYHQLGKRGSFGIADRQIILDFKSLVSDEHAPSFVLVHESVHNVFSVETEFAHVTHLIYKLEKEFTLPKGEIDKILQSMYDAQYFVQEGIATLVPFCLLREKVGKEDADKWKELHITGNYLAFIEKLYFITEFDLKSRSKFLSKIPSLVMESGFRINAPNMDLLKSANDVSEYLAKAENNPNKRMEIAIDAVQRNPSLLDLEIPALAKELKIPYLPASKSDVATFMTYLLSKTKHPMEYKEEHIKDVPEGTATLNDGFDNMIVANLNFDFSQSSEILFDPNDFVFMSDKMEVIFVHELQDDTTDMQFLRKNSKSVPEIAIVGFIPEGEKYITFLSKEDAIKIINNELKDITMAIKWGDFDFSTGTLFWSKQLRPPELVIYNSPAQMKLVIDKLIQKLPDTKFTHLHSGFMENSQLQMLYVTVNDEEPIHTLNHFGNKGISQIIKVIKPNSEIMNKAYILGNKKTINNYLSFWCGQRWEADWVEVMFDKTHAYFRDGRKIPVPQK